MDSIPIEKNTGSCHDLLNSIKVNVAGSRKAEIEFQEVTSHKMARQE